MVNSPEWQRISERIGSGIRRRSSRSSRRHRVRTRLFRQVATGLAEAPVSLWLYLTRPFINMFHGDLTPVGFLYLLLCGVWELLVWGLFGGAITRIAALKFTRDEAPDLPGRLKHAFSKLPSYSLAPLIALAGAAVFGMQLVVLGCVMRLDVLALVAGFAWPFVLLLGLLMAILLIGALAGWPLMWATVSVEGTDAFDALSRSYAYTYQRPLRLLWYVLFAAILAAVSMFVVKLFAASAIALGNWSVDWGLDERDVPRDRRHPLPGEPDATRRPNCPPPRSRLDGAECGSAAEEGPAPWSTPRRARTNSAGSAAGLQPPRAIRFWKSLLAALAAGYQAGFSVCRRRGRLSAAAARISTASR